MELVIGSDQEVLRGKTKRIKKFDKDLYEILDNMIVIMKEKGGIGLAAPQVGILQRVMIVHFPYMEDGEVIEEKSVTYEMMNPEILKRTIEKDIGREGCLSLPYLECEIERFKTIHVQYQNRDGKRLKIWATGLLARAIQHEIDHLNGVLMIDNALETHKGVKEAEEDGTKEETDKGKSD